MKKNNHNNISQYNAKGQPWVIERSLMLGRYNQTSRWVAVFLLVLCVSIVVYFVLPKTDLPGPLATKAALAGQGMNNDPGLYREVDLLRRQLHALITGSIESKLRRIEESLRGGAVKPTDFETLQGLKDDLKVLKNYSFLDTSPASQLVVARQRLVPRQGNRGSARLMNDEQLLQEITYLKNLLYISIASCSLLFVGMGGLWLHSGYRLRQLNGKSSGSPVLLDKPGGLM